ncbi:MAG: Hsp70 family protein [Candidatus Marinimicrobia bacterium]|nr:Hsp70 family protein [Candidatus Neomarinimicrobiota bacterium]
MSRRKIDYGIDLGTTNSAIARMDKGSPVIIKSEGLQKDTTPSCVNFNRKQIIRVGDTAYNLLDSERVKAYQNKDANIINTFEEFKRTMGSDVKVHPSNMDKDYTSEELSAEVLKALKGYVRDESIPSVIITVPAKFEQHQIDATQKSAEMAGFKYCELLQEPIAASMAYGIDGTNIDGYWVVFDFGGGTFDTVLMRAEEGIMKVVDASGDNHLGGKNIDLALVDQLLIPYLKDHYTIEKTLTDNLSMDLLRNALKRIAERIKINLSSKNEYSVLTEEPIGKDDNDVDLELDMTISLDQYEQIVAPIFDRAITITNKLLSDNSIAGNTLNSILLVGGPTFSQTFRKMISEKVSDKINTSIDPMTVVAKGAALFASTRDIPEDIQEADLSKIQLIIKYPETTVETTQTIGVKVDTKKSKSGFPEELYVELSRKDGGWSSGRVYLEGLAELVTVNLLEGKPNGFDVSLYDSQGNRLPSEPTEISIIQGFKVPGAVLTYDICVDAFELEHEKQHLIPIKGLEKNATLPAKGTEIFKTQKDIRPGKKEDIITIPVYGGDPRTRSILNNYAGTVCITGENLPSFLPKGSDVELTLRIDSSRRITVQASFPYLDDELYEETISKYTQNTPTYSMLKKELNLVSETCQNLSGSDSALNTVELNVIANDVEKLTKQLDSGQEDEATKLEVLHRTRELLKELDRLKLEGEWPNTERELIEAFEHLKATAEQFGDEKTEHIISQLQTQIDSVIRSKNSKMAIELMSQISSIDFAVVEQGAGPALYISFLKDFDDDFDVHDWKDPSAARRLINEAKNIIVSNRATTANLKPIVGELFSLLPRADQPISMRDEGLLQK